MLTSPFHLATDNAMQALIDQVRDAFPSYRYDKQDCAEEAISAFLSNGYAEATGKDMAEVCRNVLQEHGHTVHLRHAGPSHNGLSGLHQWALSEEEQRPETAGGVAVRHG